MGARSRAALTQALLTLAANLPALLCGLVPSQATASGGARRTSADATLGKPTSRMNLENVQRVSAASESACIAVLQKPVDAAARKLLFLALADLTDPAFQGEKADDYSSQLISEVRLWADIVRTRIQLARDRMTLKPTLRITYSVQQLLPMLSDLARECSRCDTTERLLDPQASPSANGLVGSSAVFAGRARQEAFAHVGRLPGALSSRRAVAG